MYGLSLNVFLCMVVIFVLLSNVLIIVLLLFRCVLVNVVLLIRFLYEVKV